MRVITGILICLCIYSSISSCKDSTTEQKEVIQAGITSVQKDAIYENFLHNGLILEADRVNRVSIDDIFFVALPEIPSSGYLWHYKISNSSAIILMEEGGYDLHSEDTFGGTIIHIWKFKSSQAGDFVITFNKYRPWIGEEGSIEKISFVVEATY